MRIWNFADTRFPIERANGVQTMATCHALARRGHEVRLLTRPPTGGDRDPFTFYGWPAVATLRFEHVAGTASTAGRRLPYLFAALRRAVVAPADVIFTRDLGLAELLLRGPRWRRPPVVYESHGISPIVRAAMAEMLGKPELCPSKFTLARLDRRERFVWRRAEAYVTITRALEDELAHRYGRRDRVFVIPDGVRLIDAPAVPMGSATAGYAGHLYPWKGVDIFVQALALAPSVRGLIVGGHPGEPDLARVQTLIALLRLESRVRVTGLVPPPDVAAHLAETTMLVLPNPSSAISERYTSPLKLFEYLSLARPIIASDLPAIREILTDEQTALLVPAGDAPALAAAMSRLASDAALTRRLAASTRALAEQYTWARRAERLEQVFHEAARR